MCLSLSEILKNNNYYSRYITEASTTKSVLEKDSYDLIILDLKMPEISGIDLLKTIKDNHPNIPVIMITGYPSIDNVVKAMKFGAANFYTKPLDLSKLLNEVAQLTNNNAKYLRTDNISNYKYKMLSINPVMEKVKETLEIAAKTDAPVIITGESGTGKELAANILHYSSNRAKKPYIKVNSAALPETLLESELFGFEKWTLTDAKEKRIGKFESANNGTIFLDEIGDMSLNTQAKILRVIQEKEITRLGGNSNIPVDIRIITATNKNIKEMIKAKDFREDLYYRFSVIHIHIPPLRERKDDILLLTNHFIRNFNSFYKKNITGISQNVENVLLNHDWPGNIRELKNTIERAVIFCKNDTISIEDFPDQYESVSKELKNSYSGSDSYFESISNLNKKVIIDALTQSKGIKHKAAKLLNIDRKTLYNRMKKLGLQ